MKFIYYLFIFIFLNPLAVSADDKLFVLEAKKEVVLKGYTRTVESRTVSSEISGKVLKVYYDVGQITGSKPFLEIDPAFINYQINGTTRSLEKIEISIVKAESRVAYLGKESTRIENLFKDDMVTESKKDEVFQKLEQARLELASAEKEKSVILNTLNELNERKERHSIYAPKGWVVTDRNIEEGEVVQSSTPLAKVSDYRKLVVPLSVSNDELTAIDGLADVFEGDLEGHPVKTSINWINPEFDEKTRKLKIELLIKDYNGPKRGGLSYTLPLHIKTEGLHIPKKAIVNRYENPTVTIKETGETVQLLVIGESNSDLLIVEDKRLVPGTELVPAEENN